MRSRSASLSGGSFNSDRKSRTSASAAAAAALSCAVGPAPPEHRGDRGGDRREDIRHDTPSALDSDHRTGERARIERTLKRRLPGRQEPLHDACEPLRRRKEHRDPHDVIGRMVGGKERHPVDRRGEDAHQRRRERKGDDRDERRYDLEQHVGKREALGRRAGTDRRQRGAIFWPMISAAPCSRLTAPA